MSAAAVAAIGKADAVWISPISFYEIGQKVRIGKWPEMLPYIDGLPALVDAQGGLLATLSPKVCLQAATMAWSHRDPFDRLLAATALDLAIPIVSIDAVFDTLPAISRIW